MSFLDTQIFHANVINSFIVDHECAVRMLKRCVRSQNWIVRFNYSGRNFFSFNWRLKLKKIVLVLESDHIFYIENFQVRFNVLNEKSGESPLIPYSSRTHCLLCLMNKFLVELDIQQIPILLSFRSQLTAVPSIMTWIPSRFRHRMSETRENLYFDLKWDANFYQERSAKEQKWLQT